MVLNSESELSDELRQTGVEFSGSDLQRKLRQADNRRVNSVGRVFVDRRFIQFEEESVVDLHFTGLESFDKVYNRDTDEVVDESLFSVDEGTGEVSFDQSYVDDNFFEGLVLKFYYVPSIFKQLELFIAQRNVLETQTVVTSDNVENTQTERLNTRIQAIISRINGSNSVGVQSGENLNRGSNPVDRRGGN